MSECTGANARFRAGMLTFERDSVTEQVREVQGFVEKWFTGRLAVGCTAPESVGTVELTAKVNPGIIAAVLGPVEFTVKRNKYIVILGTSDPNKMICGTEAESQKVVNEPLKQDVEEKLFDLMRKKTFKCKSSVIGNFDLHFDFNIDSWMVTTRGAATSKTVKELSDSGVQEKINVISNSDLPTDLDSPRFLERCFGFNIVAPNGIVQDAETVIKSAASGLTETVLARTCSLMANETETVSLPTPDRDGKPSRTNQGRMTETGWSYRMLALVAVCSVGSAGSVEKCKGQFQGGKCRCVAAGVLVALGSSRQQDHFL